MGKSIKRFAKIAIGVGVLATAGIVAMGVNAQSPRYGHGRGGFEQDPTGGAPRGLMQNWRGLTKDEFDARTRERFARLDKNSDGFADAAEIEAVLTERMSGRWSRWRGGDARGAEQGRAPGLPPMLARLDANKDGKVSKDEALAATKKRFGAADLDGDGRITDADLPPMLRGQNFLSREAPLMGGGGERGRWQRMRERFAGHHGGHHGADGPEHQGRGDGRGRGEGRGHGEGRGPGSGGGMGAGDGMGGGMMGGIGWLLGADTNKDGIITLDEANVRAEKRFSTADRNKDGVIDAADFDALRKETVEYRVKRFLHQFGAVQAGKVTREQFFARANERFAELDQNRDGRIGGRGWGGGERRGPGGAGPGPGPGGPPPAPKQ